MTTPRWFENYAPTKKPEYELQRQIADLERQNKDLRDAVAALLAPAGLQLFAPASPPAEETPATFKDGQSCVDRATADHKRIDIIRPIGSTTPLPLPLHSRDRWAFLVMELTAARADVCSISIACFIECFENTKVLVAARGNIFLSFAKNTGRQVT